MVASGRAPYEGDKGEWTGERGEKSMKPGEYVGEYMDAGDSVGA